MTLVLAVYGKEDILCYVRGTLNDDAEKQEIERLVKSDPRAANIVCKLHSIELDDAWAFDERARSRLARLQRIAEESGLLAQAMH